MFKVEGKSVQLAFKRKLTEKQRLKLGRLDKAKAIDYLLTIVGLKKTKLTGMKLQDRSQANDQLADKPKGMILESFKSLLNNGPNINHFPMGPNNEQWIGVEIECLIPKKALDFNDDGDVIEYDSESDVRNALRSAIKNANVTRCSVKDDGSVSGEDAHSCEVTLLYNSAHGHDQLIKLCKVLTDFECFVNTTCGLHVHLDSRGCDLKTVRQRGRALAATLPILKYMVPESRRSNTYAKMGMSKFKGNRYFAVNLTAFKKYNTIEVRLHSGTINSTKIVNWIELLYLISRSGIKRSISTFQDLIDSVNMPDKLVEYVERRILEFNPEVLTPFVPIQQAIEVPIQCPMPQVAAPTMSQNEAA